MRGLHAIGDGVLSSEHVNALHKLQKYRTLELCSDGFYRGPGTWWSMRPNIVRKLIALDLARAVQRGTRTFVEYVEP